MLGDPWTTISTPMGQPPRSRKTTIWAPQRGRPRRHRPEPTPIGIPRHRPGPGPGPDRAQSRGLPGVIWLALAAHGSRQGRSGTRRGPPAASLARHWARPRFRGAAYPRGSISPRLAMAWTRPFRPAPASAPGWTPACPGARPGRRRDGQGRAGRREAQDWPRNRGGPGLPGVRPVPSPASRGRPGLPRASPRSRRADFPCRPTARPKSLDTWGPFWAHSRAWSRRDAGRRVGPRSAAIPHPRPPEGPARSPAETWPGRSEGFDPAPVVPLPQFLDADPPRRHFAPMRPPARLGRIGGTRGQGRGKRPA